LLAEIEAALSRIRESIYVSPCAHSEALSRLSSNTLFLKLENLQMTGSFKERAR
jgi:threonine dehydratase